MGQRSLQAEGQNDPIQKNFGKVCWFVGCLFLLLGLLQLGVMLFERSTRVDKTLVIQGAVRPDASRAGESGSCFDLSHLWRTNFLRTEWD